MSFVTLTVVELKQLWRSFSFTHHRLLLFTTEPFEAFAACHFFAIWKQKETFNWGLFYGHCYGMRTAVEGKNHLIISKPTSQDNDGDMLRVQLTNHEPSSRFSLERWKWLGWFDARTSNFCEILMLLTPFKRQQCSWQFFYDILGMRINHSPTSWWPEGFCSSDFGTITSEHFPATRQQKPTTQLFSTAYWHTSRMEWDGLEEKSKATFEPKRNFGRPGEKFALA